MKFLYIMCPDHNNSSKISILKTQVQFNERVEKIGSWWEVERHRIIKCVYFTLQLNYVIILYLTCRTKS